MHLIKHCTNKCNKDNSRSSVLTQADIANMNYGKRDLRGLSSTLIHFWILHVDVTWMTSHIKLYSSYMFFTLEIKLTVLLKEKLFKGMIHMLLLALLFQCCTHLHSCRGQKIVYSSPCSFVCLRKYVILCMWNGRKKFGMYKM